MLSIANVCLSDTRDDAGESAVVWAEALAGRGHDVHSIATEGSQLSQALRDRALNQITVPRKANRLDLRASLKIRSFLKRHSIEVVQVHRLEDLRTVYPGLLGVSDTRLFLLAGDLPGSQVGPGALDGLINRKLSGAIVPTAIGKRVVSVATGLPEDRISVIPPGFDPAAYEPGPDVRSEVRVKLELKDDHVLVGTIGRIEREKGQYELLEAARTVLRSYSLLRLVIAGDPVSVEGAKFLEFMRKKVHAYHLDEVVKLVSLSKDVSSKSVLPVSARELLSAFDIFVMPSLEENFSGPLAEAMLSGLACVGTEAGGTPEVLDDGKAGLLAPSGSADGIARAVTMLFETPELREILGRRARESARERFDSEQVMKQVEALYSNP